MYNSFTVQNREPPCRKPPVPHCPPDPPSPPPPPPPPPKKPVFSSDMLIVGLVLAVVLSGKQKDTLLLAALAYILL